MLLPATVVAAICGMTAPPDGLQLAWVFFMPLAGMVVVGSLLIFVMRRRRRL